MKRYLLQRMLFAAFTLFVLISAVFFLLRAAPGGPFDSEKSVTREVKAEPAAQSAE